MGSGIAGLGAAYALSRTHDVELFEASDEPGGHVLTSRIDGVAVDCGFIVFNETNYPLFTRLLRELEVATRPTVMSFASECGCGLAWSSRTPWRAREIGGEIMRFLRTAGDADPGDRTLAVFLDDEGYSERFRWHYAMPMTAALWSAAPSEALDVPAELVLGFFRSHGLLGLRRHRWRTIVGGSDTYVRRLLDRISARVHLGTRVAAVRRAVDHVELDLAGGESRRFDGLVLAVHAPDALALLVDPSDEERAILSAFEVVRNEVVLHTDESLLPRKARAAWNHRSPGCGVHVSQATVTYSMRRLQGLQTDPELCVTLNRTDEIDPGRIVAVHRLAHPRLTLQSMRAAERLPGVNGPRRTAFCGAWQGFGFHEDGLASGLRAAAAFGGRWP